MVLHVTFELAVGGVPDGPVMLCVTLLLFWLAIMFVRSVRHHETR